MSVVAYIVLVGVVAMERVVELVVSTRNARWSVRRGGIETGRSHYPFMVMLHVALLVACVVEVLVADRPFIAALGWSMLALVVLAQGLRWWCIATLGRQWTTRVIVVPGMSRVSGGPYRYLRHPNYVAVALEGFALPLVHTAWMTALAFTVLNAALMAVRIADENRALGQLTTRAVRA